MKKILFNRPYITGKEQKYFQQVLKNGHFSGSGPFTKKCSNWLQKNTGASKAFLSTSCTHALEMSALVLDIQPGDEIIMPSFTSVSTANPYVLRGARIIFVDIRHDTMNIDETKIEPAISSRTKAIVPVHYAGVGCEMDTIMAIARRHHLWVVEDAAQGVLAYYKGKPLGSIGHLGCFSFHETKNFHCGEGGAFLVNDQDFIQKSEIIRENGTNRSQFLRGEIDRYSWVDVGSSYLLSELNAAFLLAQLEGAAKARERRLKLWLLYYKLLMPLAQKEKVELPVIPDGCDHNGHIFYIKLNDLEERQALIRFLKKYGIHSAFHFVPLHSAKAGCKFSEFYGEDVYTTKESGRLLRLPMFYDLKESQVEFIVTKIQTFFSIR